MSAVTAAIENTKNNAELAIPHIIEYLGGNAQAVTPDDAEGTINTVLPASTRVRLGANVNGVTDFTVLPALADVPGGHCIRLIAGVAASEVRTPADSDEEINSENCDGTKELLLTAGDVYEFIKIDATIGWMCRSFTPVGTVVASITPD